MKMLWCGLAVLSVLGACCYAVAYKDGKEVMDRKYKADVIKMQWGSADKVNDRLIGSVRVYIEENEDPYPPITLVFDAYARKASTNEATVLPNGQRVSPKAARIDTIDAGFDFHKYGYKRSKNYIEGEFCVDFPRNTDAGRLQLSAVKVNGASVTYQTTFNMNSSLLRSNFQIAEPKSTATKAPGRM